MNAAAARCHRPGTFSSAQDTAPFRARLPSHRVRALAKPGGAPECIWVSTNARHGGGAPGLRSGRSDVTCLTDAARQRGFGAPRARSRRLRLASDAAHIPSSVAEAAPGADAAASDARSENGAASTSSGSSANPSEKLWCEDAPSAEATLRAIVEEVKDLRGNAADMSARMASVLAEDPSASVRNQTLRAAVAHLLNLRELRSLRTTLARGADAAPGSGAPAPAGDAIPPWSRTVIEGELFKSEVRRVHADLLKDSDTLRQEAAARAAAPPAAAAGAPAAEPAGPMTPRTLLLALWNSPVFRLIRNAFGVVYGVFVTPLLFSDPSRWRTRDIEQYAEVLRHDASLQALLLKRLNEESPKAVIARVQSKRYACNAACVVELIKALVKTRTIDHYAGAGPPPASIPHTSLPLLLSEMLQRLTPAESPSVATAGFQGVVGSTQAMPLHIRLDSLPLPKANPIMAVLRSSFHFFFTTLIIIALWVLGAAAESKLSGGELSSGLAAQSSSLGDKSSSYAPKEYNRDVIPEASKKTFADVKGCAEAKEELMEVVEYLKNPQRFAKMGAKLPKGVLLTGPPGTGKTLLARAVAGEANVPFFYRAGSEFEEMFVGVGSRRVRALFQAAKKKAPCIIFIDEIDSIGSNRKQWDNHSRKTLNQMLTEMDGFEENTGVIIMAATNLPEVLDPALTRPGRFDRRVTVNVPDIKGREEILTYYLSSKPLAADVNVNHLARKTTGFSGAQLANMVNEAALQAAKEGAELMDLRLLDEARDKVMMGKERSLTRTVENIERTAYHEAGHALVALWTNGADPLHKATINPRGDALGLTWQMAPQDEYSRSRSQMAAAIDVCMGGQAAETIIYGSDQIGSGATSDLKHATSLARHMVCHCGFSPEIGPVYIDDASSPQIRQQADAAVSTMLKEARTRVSNMLEARLPELHAVAQALISDETLDAQQILDICARTRAAAGYAMSGADAVAA